VLGTIDWSVDFHTVLELICPVPFFSPREILPQETFELMVKISYSPVSSRHRRGLNDKQGVESAEMLAGGETHTHRTEIAGHLSENRTQF